ncbi:MULTISPECIES: hypothetical protein [unclassified Sphingomonas]|uniref:hypothetical protein n=1 Tax=unclassified Sphingomonas TaxID=196159 RepID=UPI0009280E9A|nr:MULTISPECIES: hypothetical protein [unclassified Sphingomonas]MBN8848043.1 hypothetical protein [Sphingomonas sp.]OJV29747.1 MAG: hypothetical protein BGO24_18870 [Sphingomonas sp. 67-36]
MKPPGSIYRLTDDVARSRVCYPAPLESMPAVMLIDIPAGARGDALLLGRYYPIVIESPAEHDELEAFLGAARAGPSAPDLLDRRASQLALAEPLIARYDPPESGWPWLVLTGWPDEFARLPEVAAIELARDRYATDAFWSEDEAAEHCGRLLRTFERVGRADVRIVSGQGPGARGSA